MHQRLSYNQGSYAEDPIETLVLGQTCQNAAFDG
jgi:hypothetical protein